MADKPGGSNQLRSRSPDGASDLALYAAPIALAAPIIAASEAGAVQSPAPLAQTGWSPATPPAPQAASLPDWGDGAKTDAGASGAPPAPDLKAAAMPGPGEPNVEKVVAFHVGSAPPPATAPVSQLDPIARTEPDAVAPTGRVDAASAANDGLNAVEQAGALAILQNLASAPQPDDSLSALPQAALGTVEAVIEATTSAAGSLIGTIATTADATVDTLTATIGSTVETLTSTVSTTLETLLGELGAVGGADPLGGLATLVDLVGSDSLFGPPPVAAETLAAPVTGPVGELVDGLGLVASEDAAPSDVLLGVPEQNSGPLGLLDHLIDDAI